MDKAKKNALIELENKNWDFLNNTIIEKINIPSLCYHPERSEGSLTDETQHKNCTLTQANALLRIPLLWGRSFAALRMTKTKNKNKTQ
ncbi:hypothetical protein [Pedobacter miscanthi]|uniref:hypothetical protein n=1 Tax=Pedobacter miscanthi TaxID=2259170 RepID=UPI0013141D57|nr:hypothetical protein [Pedobacter miscanthi]